MIRTTQRLLGAVLVILATGTTLAHADPGVVVFGDSLSDTGNVFAATGQLNLPPYDDLDAFRIPNYPYAAGAGRFTNGRTWVELAAREFGLQGDVRAALRWAKPGRNYAFGSARAGAPLVPNDAWQLTEQVTRYLDDVNGIVAADQIIVLFIGGNDVADSVRALSVDATGGTSIQVLLAGLESVGANLERLAAAGARAFLILNVPNVASVPALNPPLAPPGLAGIATCWTVLFNEGTPLPAGCPALPPGLPGLNDIAQGLGANPGIEVKLIDTFTFFGDVIAHPANYGIRNVTDTCVTPNTPPYQCASPKGYFFWDGVHPTRAVHQLLAHEVVRQLGIE